MIPKVRTIFKQSFRIANRLGATNIIPEHIILAIFEDELNNVVSTLSEMGSDSGHLSSIIEGYLLQSIGNPPLKPKIIPFNESSKRVVSRAEMESDKLGDESIGVEHIFLAILKNESLNGTRLLGNQGITYKTFKQTLTQIKEQTMSMTDGFDELDDNFQKNMKNKSGKSKTPILDNFGKDITKLAEEGGIDPIIGRDKEVERVAQILSRRKKNNPILIGEPGCVLGSTKITVKKISDLNTHGFINR